MILSSMFSAFSADNLKYLLGGLGITILVSVVSIVLSFVIGSILGVIRYEKIPYFSRFVGLIIDIVRNLPLLLIIFFTYFALPRFGVHLSILTSAIIAMTAFESMMVAEIIRGGLKSIDFGQTEGARSTGMSNAQTMWHIILPQAYKTMIPPLISQFISLVKDTSLATAIVLPELMYRAQIVYGQDNTYMVPILLLIAAMYFVVNYGLSLLAKWFDSKLA
ncbi:amino acid ABC transporter permease [Leuconostoc fallax]|uniref:amino acid ABC transporter permease n=1 Tax=Leuconostoc fallax TaxID=1251 RepID=UPI0004957037|nr:amino acid ABC transporter permease [Leuconostoc fallax]MBU7455906.1 amino acid ABC transporter permease [Leuconostoc fallax]MCO6184410.1 amino acid ABC transporter permease [Leuconostoc fallax]